MLNRSIVVMLVLRKPASQNNCWLFWASSLFFVFPANCLLPDLPKAFFESLRRVGRNGVSAGHYYVEIQCSNLRLNKGAIKKIAAMVCIHPEHKVLRQKLSNPQSFQDYTCFPMNGAFCRMLQASSFL
jgi:hypothetical protein